MNIEQLTIAEARQIAAIFGANVPTQTGAAPYRIGANYFIRTVTHHYTGKLVAVYPQELVLEGAAWIADDGRFADALKSCQFAEVEPYPVGPVIIGRGVIEDASEISTIPTSQK